jgi:hypothetical protein
MEWPIPTENQNPWYEAFVAFISAQDASAFAAREDRQVIMLGGGTVSWAVPTLTWTSVFRLTAPIEGFLWEVPAGTVTIEDGEALYAVLVRGPVSNTVVGVAVASQVPSSDQALVLAVRVGSRIYFRTGMSLGDGESSSGGVSPSGQDNFWGTFATTALLPNVAGSPTQSAALTVGATTYSVADATTYQCTDATPGAAVWTPMGGGGGGAGSYLQFGPYAYTQAPVPVEEVVAEFAFDGSLVGTSAISFVGVMRPTFTAAGWARLRLYDMGPSGAPGGVPRLVATLQRVAGGLMDVSQSLTVVPVAPGANQILDTKRVYEIVVIQASAVGDTVYVGSAGLEVV